MDKETINVMLILFSQMHSLKIRSEGQVVEVCHNGKCTTRAFKQTLVRWQIQLMCSFLLNFLLQSMLQNVKHILWLLCLSSQEKMLYLPYDKSFFGHERFIYKYILFPVHLNRTAGSV